MNIEKMKALLKDRRLDVVSKATKVHPNTISRIRDGKIDNPSHKVFSALSDYLESQGNE